MCLRGIGDTDFSLSFKKNKKGLYTEPRLELYSKSKLLISDIQRALLKLSFTCTVEKKNKKITTGICLEFMEKTIYLNG